MNTCVAGLVAMVAAHTATVGADTWPRVAPQEPVPVRVALLGFSGERSAEVTASLRRALSAQPHVVALEQSQVSAAANGFGYDGSINMTKEEARRLGAAIGCDVFVTGKVQVLSRSARSNESHGEAIIGVMLVDGRTGSLALFDFIAESRATEDTAFAAAITSLDEKVQGYTERILKLGQAQPVIIAPASSDRVEDVPDEGTAAAAGFKPPEFLNRVKPEYTDQADRAGITATVEAMAVFLRTGEVGQIEVTRWAGFGLDEAAVQAIRQLKFKPATRDGQPLSVRAMVRYNFRRAFS